MKLPLGLRALLLAAQLLAAQLLAALFLAALFLATFLAPPPITADADIAAAAHASAADATDAVLSGPTDAGYSAIAARAAISSGRGSPRAGPVPASAWSWPLSPRPAVLRAFDPPAKPWLSGHRGVDLEAPFDGAPLKSPAAGTVSFVGTVVDRPVITIDHGNGLRSSFEPVASSLRAGSAVAEGDVLGQVQTGHCGPAPPCLHWGVRRGEDYVNPLAFVMDLRPSVLLPPLNPGP
ncbi:M23 family metallopeptidase [Arthrobacter sp. I3]|jgi:murein DD-endopeptidase MepM/ murein hydrolase activator NlpD|uniref:M23 family metallopeptidase n=1 Tax=Arthrobacter sp. I3 TaxID=218158 RepID=UPI000489CAFF|nr:M23 family metallopeptidase [Arthrobacter sp. I3]